MLGNYHIWTCHSIVPSSFPFILSSFLLIDWSIARMAGSVDLNRLVTSSITAENLQALTRIRDSPSLYTSIAPLLNGFFTRCLQNADPSLRVMARESFLSLAGHIGRIRDTQTMNSLFAPLARYLISCEQDLPSEREEDDSTLLILSGLTTTIPRALAPHLPAIVNYCHQTASSTENAPSSRQKALNLLESLSEHSTDSIPVKSLALIVDSCLVTMSNIDWGAKEWGQGTESHFMTEAAQGKDCLSRVVSNLHERNIVTVVIAQTGQFLLDVDWKCRLAGVAGLEVIGTTGRIVLIEQILCSLASVLKDPDAIVRGAACRAISTLIPNLGPNPVFLQDIVPLLVDSMADTSIPRVTSQAAETICRIVIHCPKHIPVNLDALISAISINLEEAASMESIDNWRNQLIRSVLTIVMTLASSSIPVDSPADSMMNRIGMERKTASHILTTEGFAVIYDRLIESLKKIIPNKQLADPLLDCIAHMAIAVGQSKFAADAQVVLNGCVRCMDSLTVGGCESVLKSLRGMVNVLNKENLPFLPLIMPSLTRMALCPPYGCPPYDLGSSLEEWQSRKQSCYLPSRILNDLASLLKGSFKPYVLEVTNIFTNNLKYSEVAMSFPTLLNCIKDEGSNAMRALFLIYWKAIKEAVKCPSNKGLFWKFVGGVANCMKTMGPQGFSSEEVKEIGEMIKEVLENRLERDDGEEIIISNNGRRVESEAEELLTQNISVLIHCLLKAEGVNSFEVVHSLIPVVLSSMRNSYKRLRIIGNYIQMAPQLAFTRYTELSVLISTSFFDDLPDYRREAAYALGCTALSKSPLWIPLVVQSIPSISTAISRPDAWANDDCMGATETAISAAAKIIKNCEGIDTMPLLTPFVDWLYLHGIRREVDESTAVYGTLIDLVQSNNPLIVGVNNGNWPKLITIFIQALIRIEFDEELAEGKEVKKRVQNTLKEMKLSNERLFNERVALSGLEAEEKQMLKNLLD